LRSFLARQPRRCLESGSLLPPQAALRRFSTVAAMRFAGLSGPPTAPLPRKRLASSTAGGASPLFHRCGNAVCGPFWPANRAAASKAARFFRRRRRFAAFPWILPPFEKDGALIRKRPVDFWKYLGDPGGICLRGLFHALERGNRRAPPWARCRFLHVLNRRFPQMIIGPETAVNLKSGLSKRKKLQ